VDDPGVLRRLADRVEIIDAVLRFSRAMDLQDWALLRSCLAAAVDVDYSDLRGEPPATVPADEFVASRATGLRGLKTQHISTNHLVSVDGDRAECSSCFLIHRLDPTGPAGDDTFDSAGHYTHRLQRTPQGWRIAAITQTVLWSRGNPEVHGALRRGKPAR
jgi:SnoaL-like protein